MTNYFNDYGNVYCIKFKKRDGLKTDILIWEIDYKGKALFFEGKNFDYLILYDTFNRPAYDCYYDLKGEGIRKMETTTAGIMIDVFKDLLTYDPTCADVI